MPSANTNHLTEAPPPNTITLGGRFSTYLLGRPKHAVPNRYKRTAPESLDSLPRHLAKEYPGFLFQVAISPRLQGLEVLRGHPNVKSSPQLILAHIQGCRLPPCPAAVRKLLFLLVSRSRPPCPQPQDTPSTADPSSP